jgi:two-component system OmpR family response regulator
MHIVFVEDNLTLAKATMRVLKQEGYTPTYFTDGAEAERWLIANNGSYDLVILDILLPGMDGYTICKNIRAARVQVPVLMLTSKDSVADTIEGLDSGADDYLKKPFDADELLARIRTLLRRAPLPEEDVTESLPGITIDMRSHKITTSDDQEISLTTKEFAILIYFLRHKGDVINQQQLYDHIFDFAEVQLSNTIEVHIKNIRKKFRDVDYEIPLTTIRGSGYRLDI